MPSWHVSSSRNGVFAYPTEEGRLHQTRRALIAALAGLAAAVAVGCGYGAGEAGGRTLRWYAYNEPGGSFDDIAKECTEKADGRYAVEVVKLPQNADQQRELLVRRLAAEDSDIDLMTMDVIWTAEFAGAGWIKEWTGENEAAARRGRIPALVETAEYRDKLWGAPFNTNTQLLWFNKDLVKGKPPETWDEVLQQADRLGPEKGKVWVQAARYEGLVVWFTAMVGSLGGRIVDEQGRVQIDDTARRAADVMRRLASSSAAPEGLNNMKEDEARLGFQEGASAFQVNYPFIYASAGEEAPDFQKKIGFARYPGMEKGKPSTPPIGGFNVGVGSYSENPELAFQAAQCLTSYDSQLIANQKGGLPPTIEALYEDPKLRETYPFADLLRESLEAGQPRPATPAYSDVSLAIQAALHPTAGIEPDKVVADLRDKLKTVAEGGLF